MNNALNQTNAAQDAVAIASQIAHLEDMAQNAEDNEQLGKASKLRAQTRELKTQLAAAVAAMAVAK